MRKVTGSRCLCRDCNEYFNSVAAFDKHRRGPMDSRRCDTAGMVKNNAGYWITAPRYQETLDMSADGKITGVEYKRDAGTD